VNDSDDERVIYTLSQLGESLRRTLERATEGNAMWFRAEVAQVKGSGAGHVYLDLVEEDQGTKLAAMRATIWRDQHREIVRELGDAASDVLRKGAEIVFSARVRYHAVYGVSLAVETIDLSAMLGEAERRKQATLLALRAEGALERNGRLPLPRLVTRVALVGSPGTSGFRDFAVHLLCNEGNFRYDVEVFSASVQGKDATPSLRHALVKAEAWKPDAVVVVRGGGSALDLDAFNDLELCRTVADLGVPVLTGIGHETDLSVVDMVAHRAFKTPTAVADFLIDRSATEAARLQDALAQISVRARGRLGVEHQRLASHRQFLQLHPAQTLNHAQVMLQHLRERLHATTTQVLERHVQRMAQLQSTLNALRPDRTLQRGFAVVRRDGASVRDASALAVDDLLTLTFHLGTAEARVTQVRPANPVDGTAAADAPTLEPSNHDA
jgi:exodeoxyribonuclease VII large subunit